MKKSYQNHPLTLAIIVSFFILASGCSSNSLQIGSINYFNKVEDKTNEGNYLELNNGTKIKGDTITWKAGSFVKDEIKIDNQSLAVKEVKGYRKEDDYYIRIKKEYIKRIVHGTKINIYMMSFNKEYSNGNGGTSVVTKTNFYSQKGDDSPLEVFHKLKSIRRLVADCPVAIKMLDKRNWKIRKAMRKNGNYLNSVFDVYNNNCKE